ncbi:MAG TPA: hypothetical protein VG826_26265 [Pirellulales bacterium]|nr:hypothetical protein [Pirellulales bacterium]
MSNEPTNTDRAAWAKDALAVFTAATFSGDHPNGMHRGDLECAVGDLITDLLHFALQQGFDAGAILQNACGNFGSELLDEACRGVTKPGAEIVSALIEALHYLLEQTIDMDLKYGLILSEGEEDARAKALSAIARAVHAGYGRPSVISPSTKR